jgi:hypothetical protein
VTSNHWMSGNSKAVAHRKEVVMYYGIGGIILVIIIIVLLIWLL